MSRADGPEERREESEFLDQLEAEVLARHEALANDEDPLPPPCSDARGHDWQRRTDWWGDANVYRGTQTFTFWVCRRCGVEETVDPTGGSDR